MWDIVFYLLMLTLLAGLVLAGAVFIRAYLTGTSPTSTLFGPKPERRLEVVEHSNVDGRRRLVLIRRDDVEHLIMTGGPVDVVIETGIQPYRGRLDGHAETAAQSSAVYARGPRSFAQAAGEH